MTHRKPTALVWLGNAFSYFIIASLAIVSLMAPFVGLTKSFGDIAPLVNILSLIMFVVFAHGFIRAFSDAASESFRVE